MLHYFPIHLAYQYSKIDLFLTLDVLIQMAQIGSAIFKLQIL